MNITNSIKNRRSIRLYQNKPVPESILLELADLARFYPSAGNLQPIRTAIVTKEPTLNLIFDALGFAMYAPDFQIQESERPAAYIILLGNRPECQFDAGAAAQSVMLAAQVFGLSTCCLGIGKKEQIQNILQLHDLLPIVAIAIGFSAHSSTEIPYEGSFLYVMDDNRNFFVPKLPLAETLCFSDL